MMFIALAPRKCMLRWALAAALMLLFSTSSRLRAQSTFGNIVGTVTDPSGASLPNATATLINTGTDAHRTAHTDAQGEYSFNILDTGTYKVLIEAPGFTRAEFRDVALLARETKRIDASLLIGSEAQTIDVSGANNDVITTETSSLATTKTTIDLVDLPVAIYSRANGSTSPISTLTTNPGVQTDSSGNLVIAGATPALLSVTLDGISSVDVENSGPDNELFPSFNSISEIRVSETNNNAEYSGVADITTTSRAGTNTYHGGLFENHINTALNAGDPFTGSKPKTIMNNFGGFLGGPLLIPHAYNGHDRTFVFLSYEGLRLPREVPLVTSVPSLAMRQGNLTSYLEQQGTNAIFNPDGTPIDPAQVPVSPVAANVMAALYPLPNRGSVDDYQNNFAINFPAPISSNQGDIRIDQTINARQSMFTRFSYKMRNVSTAPNPTCTGFCTNGGSTLTGAFQQPETDAGLTLAHTFLITSKLVNEFRAGFNLNKIDTEQNVDTASLLAQTGITGITDVDTAASVPNVQITGFQVTGGGNPSHHRSKIIQVLDNVTWTKGAHTFKFGGDFRRLTDHDDNVFGDYRSGQYTFNGTSAPGATVNDVFTQFLLGVPDYTILATVTNPNMDGLGHSYSAFAQDDWKITPRLTLNFGFRYELHPPLKEINYDTAAFDPTYNANGVAGAVVVPNQKALTYTDPDFVTSISPTPILTAAQAHLPEALRYTSLRGYGPRIGFAWRPFEKTVIRGGWGRFIESPLGFSLVSGWSVHASFVPFYQNAYNADGVTPQLTFPSPFPTVRATPGAASFEYAFPIHYRDPSVQQWNLTYERDLGFRTGLRVSYVGSRGTDLESFEDLNQVHPSTTPYYDTDANGNYTAAAGYSLRPYQDWQIIQSVANVTESNYNALSVVVEKQPSRGLQFQSSYTYTRDLSNEGGAVPTTLVGAGGNYLTDRFHPGLDYGNVIYDRRHRFLTTGLYDLPFGHNRSLLGSANRLIDAVAGGWQVGGVLIWQSGPFLTPYEQSTDPAGTNEQGVVLVTRPDRVPGKELYQRGNQHGNPLFLNPAAFALPGSNIGRFGNAAVGSLVGPGTVALSSSLLKSVNVRESLKLQMGISAANLLNHRNYAPPNTQIDTTSFGESSALQTAEGAGPRNVQLTARITF